MWWTSLTPKRRGSRRRNGLVVYTVLRTVDTSAKSDGKRNSGAEKAFVNMAGGAFIAVIPLAEVVPHFAFTASSAHDALTQNAMEAEVSAYTVYNALGAEFAARGLHFAYIKEKNINVQSVILLATRLIERAI